MTTEQGGTMSVTPATLHHLALTVSDVDASVQWYCDVFGLTFRMDAPHEGGVGKVCTNDDWTLGFVLHRHDDNDGGEFHETVTGLDHVGLFVPTRADLESWQDHLERHGVIRSDTADKPLTQSPIADEFYGSVLVFRDPDNIQLELFAPPPQ
jgi:glyoxylase I family protein